MALFNRLKERSRFSYHFLMPFIFKNPESIRRAMQFSFHIRNVCFKINALYLVFSAHQRKLIIFGN